MFFQYMIKSNFYLKSFKNRIKQSKEKLIVTNEYQILFNFLQKKDNEEQLELWNFQYFPNIID